MTNFIFSVDISSQKMSIIYQLFISFYNFKYPDTFVTSYCLDWMLFYTEFFGKKRIKNSILGVE